MIETIMLSIIVAKVRGYNIKKILKCYSLYPIIIFELTHLILQFQIVSGNYSNVALARSYKTIYMYLFLIPIFKYRLYVQGVMGSIFIFIGTFLNNLVIHFNNGRMPVFPTISYYTGYVSLDSLTAFNSIYFLGNGNVKLKILSDWVDVGYSVLSIGDILIRVFVFIVIFNTMKEINKPKKVKI